MSLRHPLRGVDLDIFQEATSRVIRRDPFWNRARGNSGSPTAPSVAQAVYDSVPRQGAWSGNNQLGISQPFSPDSNNRQTILKLDEWGMPEVWGVMLGITYTPTALTNFEVTADITAGVGGSEQRLQLEWHQGVAFNCAMNAINVVAQYTSVGAFVIPADLRLTVTLCRGPIAGAFPTSTPSGATITTVAAGTNGSLVRIPPFTRGVQVMPLNTASAGLLYTTNNFLRFSASDIGIVNSGAIRADMLPSWGDGFVPIPSQSKSIFFQNGEASDVFVKYIFKLGL